MENKRPLKRSLTLPIEDGYLSVFVWGYILDPFNEYYEVQVFTEGKWEQKIFYTPKKVISFFRLYRKVVSSLPSSVLRVLDKSADEVLLEVLNGTTFQSSTEPHIQ
jgi:hypothetical protein